jgi:hypothetical protein
MNIIPFIGVDQISFGITEQQAIQILGIPDNEATENWADGSVTKTLQYSKQGIELSFCDTDDFRLGVITLTALDTRLLNHFLIGQQEKEFLFQMKQSGIVDFNFDEEFAYLNSKNYDCESLGLSLWVTNGITQSATIYVKYDETGNNPIWPASNGT